MIYVLQQQHSLLALFMLLLTIARASAGSATTRIRAPPCFLTAAAATIRPPLFLHHPSLHARQEQQGLRTLRSTAAVEINSNNDEHSQKKKKKEGAPKNKELTFRLDRLLANRGVGSRTEVTALIRRGKVALEDGQVVKDPSLHLSATALLLVNQEPVRPLPLLVAYHKPLGVHSTIGDPMGRPNLEDALPPRLAKIFHPVGRLDADTTGLLLFSAEGQLTQRLLHPSSNVQREYLATVEYTEPTIDVEKLRATLAAGVETADGTYEAALLGMEEQVGGEEGKENNLAVLRVGVAEGKHRMVRRLLANAGYPVVALHRVRYGRVNLGDLAEGEVKELEEDGEEGLWARDLLEGKSKKKTT